MKLYLIRPRWKRMAPALIEVAAVSRSAYEGPLLMVGEERVLDAHACAAGLFNVDDQVFLAADISIAQARFLGYLMKEGA